MTAKLVRNNSDIVLVCNNCNNIIATGDKIPYNATIKGLNSLWFCCKECAQKYYEEHGHYEYLCNIMEPNK